MVRPFAIRNTVFDEVVPVGVRHLVQKRNGTLFKRDFLDLVVELVERGDPEVVGVCFLVLDVALVRGNEACKTHLDDALFFYC